VLPLLLSVRFLLLLHAGFDILKDDFLYGEVDELQ